MPARSAEGLGGGHWPVGGEPSSEVPAPTVQLTDCGASLQGRCRTAENPCRKHALLASFQDRRQRAPRVGTAAAAKPEGPGPPVWAGPIVSLESPSSKPSTPAHREAQVLSAGRDSRDVPIPGAPPQSARPRAIEFCAGSAGLTKALAAIGFDAVGVDWIRNRHRAKAPVLRLDLSTTEGQASAWDMLSDHRVKFVHFAPPCGTFTRARQAGSSTPRRGRRTRPAPAALGTTPLWASRADRALQD